jgi:hypothetical protein
MVPDGGDVEEPVRSPGLLRPFDAVIAWVLNAGIPPVVMAVWLIATAGDEPGNAVTSFGRLVSVGLLFWWLAGVRKIRPRAMLARFRCERRAIRFGAMVGLGLGAVEYVAVVAWHFVGPHPEHQ